MGKIGMKPGGKYQVKVTEIKPCVKKFVKKDIGEVCRHDIVIEDRAGNTATCEYISKSDVPTEFALGIIQWIKCIYPDGDGGTIEPCEPPEESSRQEQPAPAPTALPKTFTEPSQADCASRNMSGSSRTFAMSYAKDLKVAEMAGRPTGSRTSTDDINDVIKWAKMIDEALCNNFK